MLHSPAQYRKIRGEDRLHGLHQGHTVSLRGPDHPPGLFRIGSQRLLAQDRLPQGHAQDTLLRMAGIRSSDIDGVYIRT